MSAERLSRELNLPQGLERIVEDSISSGIKPFKWVMTLCIAHAPFLRSAADPPPAPPPPSPASRAPDLPRNRPYRAPLIQIPGDPHSDGVSSELVVVLDVSSRSPHLESLCPLVPDPLLRPFCSLL